MSRRTAAAVICGVLVISLSTLASGQTSVTDTVASLAAKGFDVKGVAISEGIAFVVMQKSAEVYICSGPMLLGMLDPGSIPPLKCSRQK